jgi:hypothetical protein
MGALLDVRARRGTPVLIPGRASAGHAERSAYTSLITQDGGSRVADCCTICGGPTAGGREYDTALCEEIGLVVEERCRAVNAERARNGLPPVAAERYGPNQAAARAEARLVYSRSVPERGRERRDLRALG